MNPNDEMMPGIPIGDTKSYYAYLKQKFNVPDGLREHNGHEIIKWVYDNNPNLEIQAFIPQGENLSGWVDKPDPVDVFNRHAIYRIKPGKIRKRQAILRVIHSENPNCYTMSNKFYSSYEELRDNLRESHYEFISWYEPSAYIEMEY